MAANVQTTRVALLEHVAIDGRLDAVGSALLLLAGNVVGRTVGNKVAGQLVFISMNT